MEINIPKPKPPKPIIAITPNSVPESVSAKQLDTAYNELDTPIDIEDSDSLVDFRAKLSEIEELLESKPLNLDNLKESNRALNRILVKHPEIAITIEQREIGVIVTSLRKECKDTILEKEVSKGKKGSKVKKTNKASDSDKEAARNVTEDDILF